VLGTIIRMRAIISIKNFPIVLLKQMDKGRLYFNISKKKYIFLSFLYPGRLSIDISFDINLYH
jgi:hypothetical protein